MKKILKISLMVLVSIFVLGSAFFFIIKYLMPIPKVEIGTIDLKKVHDGSYIGEYSAGMVRAIVKVDVTSNRIAEIDVLKHKNGLGKKAEKITKEVERAQSLEVDTVSGATLSSRVILKAIENALHQGEK